MLYIGIDVSTTATKALLVDGAGRVVAATASAYALDSPHPLWSEQSPDVWWKAAVESVRALINQSGVDPRDIGGVGLTGQMHGLVLLGDDGRVLRPAILWNDQRSMAQCREIYDRVGRERFIQIAGNAALPGFTAPKILWVKENEPALYAQVAHVLLPKDYVRYMLTGAFAIDKADGSGTVLMNLRQRDWSQPVLDALGIPRSWMPPLYEGPQITGAITLEAGQATGLLVGTPVVAGGGDQSAQAIGVGAVVEGVAALTLGTSGVVFVTTDMAVVEPEGRLHSFCHSVPGKWHLMGVMLSAGGSLRWYRDTFAPGTEYSDLLAPVESITPGAEGLLFLPYLTGERTPHPDPYSRGAFVGLTARHTMVHCTRAVLEGVAFGLKDSFELLKTFGAAQLHQARVSGGGARSILWQHILADVLGVELVTVNTTEGAAFGAALLAAVGTGGFGDVETACNVAVRVTGTIIPDERNAAVYGQAYDTYRQIYPALRSTFEELHKFA